MITNNLKRDIRYTNKNFNDYKNSLIEYTKTYFPNTFNDFTDTSTGMLFIEMASYIGDVLSFYLDNQIQETFLQYSRQTENVFNLAYMLGYKPRVTTVSTTNLEIYQQVPAKTVNGNQVPDFTYCLRIPSNTPVTTNTNNNVSFLIEDEVDFSYSSSLDPTEISIYQIVDNIPTLFLLKKTRKVTSSTINTTTFSFNSPQKFTSVNLNSTNIIGILDIFDSEGNRWYEVDNLAQENVFDSIKNTNLNDPNFSIDTEVPYLLQIKQTQRRFATRFTNRENLQIQFGAGSILDNDEEITPNLDNVGLGLPFERFKMTTAYSPLNFVYTNTYGIAPYNTTLTIRYLTGGGLLSNIQANTLTILNTSNVRFTNSNITDNDLANEIFNSLLVNNPTASDGGSDGDTLEEIKQNTLGNFQTQLRAVTQDDYLIRALSLPSKYGSISKAYITQAKYSNVEPFENPFILELYVLSQDENRKLRPASLALKKNLQTYLSEYRMLNDSIKIKDAYIINIGIEFDVIVLPNYNNNEVLIRCINALLDYFDISKWQINEPILLKDLFILLDKIEGVQTVPNIKIFNKNNSELGYSDFAYDIEGATTCNIIYPSIDPMIFELKYPDDIIGRVVPFC
jgi:hypothetical protein